MVRAIPGPKAPEIAETSVSQRIRSRLTRTGSGPSTRSRSPGWTGPQNSGLHRVWFRVVGRVGLQLTLGTGFRKVCRVWASRLRAQGSIGL